MDDYKEKSTNQPRNGSHFALFRSSRLRQKLLIYFFLIVFVCLCVSLELIYEVGGRRVQEAIKSNIVKSLSLTGDASDRIDLNYVFAPLKKLQHRMLFVVAIVIVCVIATLRFFIRDIVQPLDGMVNAGKLIANGHLGATVPVRSHDELGQLGEVINDLAANLQEVLLLVGVISSRNMKSVANIAKIVDDVEHCDICPELVPEFEMIVTDMNELVSIVKSFDFYDVVFDGEKVVDSSIIPEE
ncbi:MAG: HAMP domain-containing protein [Deltaproteobacteria bacterium]|nr:HAMP domain-containing protein [Deltaproteobacteria bacterium]